MDKMKDSKKLLILNFDKETICIIFELLILFSICILHAAEAGHYVDFRPINGTFQNYNPVRRFLSGQIPYRDFQDYLGIGHLYVGTITTLLFGGDYQASLVAFSFLTIMGFALISIVIGSSIFGKKSITVALTNIILVMLIAQPFIYTNVLAGTNEIRDALNAVLETGNSARFVRGMILPISCMILYFFNAIYKKIIIKRLFIIKYKELMISCGIGIIAGFSFLWSTDYGISCWICLFIMVFICMFIYTRKLIKTIIISLFELFISIVSIFTFGEIFTFGHFYSWFDSIFGTGGYQSWYYNSNKSYYFYDVNFSYIMLIQGFLCITYFFKLYKSTVTLPSLKRYGVLAYINMVSFCAVNEYHMLSGNNLTEIALSVLFVTVLFEVVHHLDFYKNFSHIKKVFFTAVSIISLAWIVSDFKEEIIFKNFNMPQNEGGGGI